MILNDNYSELYTGSQGGLIQVFDLNTAKAKFSLQGHGTICSAINLINYESNPFLLASGSIDGKIKLWDLKSRNNISNGIKGHLAEIKTLCISPDCQYLLSGANDKILKVWDLRQNKLFYEISGLNQGIITSSEFCPTRKAFVFGSTDKTIRYWDLDENEQVRKKEN